MEIRRLTRSCSLSYWSANVWRWLVGVCKRQTILMQTYRNYTVTPGGMGGATGSVLRRNVRIEIYLTQPCWAVNSANCFSLALAAPESIDSWASWQAALISAALCASSSAAAAFTTMMSRRGPI